MNFKIYEWTDEARQASIDARRGGGAKLPPLRKGAKFGDDVVAIHEGKQVSGVLSGIDKTGQLKITLHDTGKVILKGRNEIGSPEGGFRQRGE